MQAKNTNQCFLGSHQTHVTSTVTAEGVAWPMLIQLQEKADFLGPSAILTIDTVGFVSDMQQCVVVPHIRV